MKTEIYRAGTMSDGSGHLVVSHVLPGRTYRVVGFAAPSKLEKKDMRFCARSQGELAKWFLQGGYRP